MAIGRACQRKRVTIRRLRTTCLGVLLVLLAMSLERTHALTIEVNQVAEAGFTVVRESDHATQSLAARLRRLHCKPLIPPAIHCFRRRHRTSDCCSRGGFPASTGSNSFVRDNSIAHNFQTGATGTPSGSAGSNGGGGGSAAGHHDEFAVIQRPASDVPSIHPVPGPIAGSGLSSLLLLSCGGWGWWYHRRRLAAKSLP